MGYGGFGRNTYSDANSEVAKHTSHPEILMRMRPRKGKHKYIFRQICDK
jgi:hypothetical protein